MSESLKPRDPERQGSLARIAQKVAAAAVGEYLDIVRKAVRRTLIPPRKEGEFFFGCVAGFILSCLISLGLTLFIPVPAPMVVLFVMLPSTLASGILSARVFSFPGQIFKLSEERDLERSEFLYQRKRLALEQRAAELKEANHDPREIEEKLGETRDRLLAEHLDALDHIPGVRTQKILEKSAQRLERRKRD